MKQSEIEKKYQAYDRWTVGKGSHRRSGVRKLYEEGWERIFGKKGK